MDYYSQKFHSKAQCVLIIGLIASFIGAISTASLVFPDLKFLVFLLTFISYGLIFYLRYRYYKLFAEAFGNLEEQIDIKEEQIQFLLKTVEELKKNDTALHTETPKTTEHSKSPELVGYEITEDGKIKCQNCGTVQRADRTKCFECGNVFKK